MQRFSKSVDELTSDLEELLAADPRPMASPVQPTSGVTVPQLKNLILQQVRQSSEPAKPQSILKNRSDGPRNGVQVKVCPKLSSVLCKHRLF